MPLGIHYARVCGRTAPVLAPGHVDLNNRGVRDSLITGCDGLAGSRTPSPAHSRIPCRDALSMTPACRLCV